MKTIALDTAAKITTRTLINLVVDTPSPGKGIDMAEMRRRDRIAKALAAVPDTVTELALEDADMAVLQQLVSQFQFNGRHEEVLAFGKAIDEAK